MDSSAEWGSLQRLTIFVLGPDGWRASSSPCDNSVQLVDGTSRQQIDIVLLRNFIGRQSSVEK